MPSDVLFLKAARLNPEGGLQRDSDRIWVTVQGCGPQMKSCSLLYKGDTAKHPRPSSSSR